MSARTLLASLRPTEKVTQHQIVRLFKLAGGIVRSTSQYRASHVAAGLPDLLVHFPAVQRFAFFEVKRPTAKGFDFHHPETWQPEPLRPDQERFRLDCEATGTVYAWGGFAEAQDLLITFGLACRIVDMSDTRQRSPRDGLFTLTPKARAA